MVGGLRILNNLALELGPEAEGFIDGYAPFSSHSLSPIQPESPV